LLLRVAVLAVQAKTQVAVAVAEVLVVFYKVL
jgi:hypothetical protein